MNVAARSDQRFSGNVNSGETQALLRGFSNSSITYHRYKYRLSDVSQHNRTNAEWVTVQDVIRRTTSDIPKGFVLMTIGGVLEPHTPLMNNTSFIVGALSFDQVFEGILTATFLTQVSHINTR